MNYSITNTFYLLLKPLNKQLQKEIFQLKKQGLKNQTIVDIGCGSKQYQSCFASIMSKYYGLDINSNSSADVLGYGHELPFKDKIADIVLCAQVLEHVDMPDRLLSEIRRILRPAGVAFISTHGTFIYHPTPRDYWRWTHEGLHLVLRKSGMEVKGISTNGGPIACLFYLCITMFSMFTYKSRFLAPLRYFFVPFFNFLGEKIDSLFVNYLYPKSKLLLVANYLVVAEKPL